MKNFIRALCAITILFLTPSCANTPKDDGLTCNHDHGSHDGHNHSHEGHNHDAETPENEEDSHESEEITLHAHQADEFGVGVDTITAGDFAQIVKVSGQIESATTSRSVVSATASGIVRFAGNITEGRKVAAGAVIASISANGISGGDANAAARAALDAAKRELDRITPLHKDGIVSTKDYNAALQAYEAAKAAYSGTPSGGSATASTAGVITSLLVRQGEYVSVGQPIAIVSGNSSLTLRADLPEKYYNFLPTVSSANFRAAYTADIVCLKDLNGKLLSSAGAVGDNQRGYLPVYFSFENNGKVVPGSFAEVYLIGAKRSGVLAVPVAAVSEQQGQHFVYVRLDADCYKKCPVILGGNDGDRVEIVSGIKSGDLVVTRGMTFVKLAETSGVVPEGHSHSH
ncbi:MAG: efflux RND transporter periplasmic adaptor subunit [Muribaculaceae bacterium]